MSCTTCKKTKADIAEDALIKAYKDNKKTINLKDYILKFLLYVLLAVISTPILIPIFLIVLFRMVVLSKEINLLPIVLYIGKKIFKDDKDEEDLGDEEDYDNLNEDDYELLDEDDIIKLD